MHIKDASEVIIFIYFKFETIYDFIHFLKILKIKAEWQSILN